MAASFMRNERVCRTHARDHVGTSTTKEFEKKKKPKRLHFVCEQQQHNNKSSCGAYQQEHERVFVSILEVS